MFSSSYKRTYIQLESFYNCLDLKKTEIKRLSITVLHTKKVEVKEMSKKISLIFMLILLITITGCSKKGPVESSEGLVETEPTTEESTEDEFAINNGNTNLPGYEVRETKEREERPKKISDEDLAKRELELAESAA